MITFQDFQKLELKVGRIVEVSDHPNADKLFVMKFDVGGGDIRQSVAGLKGHYTAEELTGKAVVVVTNLQPARLRGVESQGMLLAAEAGTEVVIISPEKEVPLGSKVH